jgi:hypothetical protein
MNPRELMAVLLAALGAYFLSMGIVRALSPTVGPLAYLVLGVLWMMVGANIYRRK